MSPVEGKFDLSTSRINRLLRPLHNRCSSLAAFYSSASQTATHRPIVATTYSSRPGGTLKLGLVHIDSHVPPLAVLQPPESVGLRINLDRNCIQSLALSQKLYAVRDCFRNVVKVAFGVGDPGRKILQRGRRDIPTLGALCAIIVGENIQPDITTDPGDVVEDLELTGIINELYEAVPLQYRRWTLVAHALNIILRTCPHHPTLLKTLLDICVSHNLVRESDIILRNLLRVALSPASIASSIPRICHPAHFNYLAELCAMWNTGSGHTDRGFISILTEVLVNIHRQDVWLCKAVIKLAHELRARDFPTFIHLVSGLVESLAPRSSTIKGKESQHHGKEDAQVQLSKWVNHCLDYVFTASDLDADTYQAVLCFLKCVRSFGIHVTVAEGDRLVSRHDLLNAVICLATWCLSASPLFASTHDLPHVVELLREVVPRTLTYSKLVACIFGLDVHCSPSVRGFSDCKRSLQTHANFLRSYRLLRLEASLWACTLHHVELFEGEKTIAARGSDHREVEQYRRDLIELVDVAERRCFGSESTGDGPSKPSDIPQISSLQTGLERVSDGWEDRCDDWEWEWEGLLGCWVRKSNSRVLLKKRTKLGYDHSPRFSRRLLARRGLKSEDQANPKSASCSASCSLVPPLGSMDPESSFTHLVSGSFSSAIENEHRDGANVRSPMTCRLAQKPASMHRSSNFTSLLADALSNRTVLHRKVGPKPVQDHSRSSLWENARVPSSRSLPLDRPPLPLSPICNINLGKFDPQPFPLDSDLSQSLPSDDALDLFAYALSSSPSTPR